MDKSDNVDAATQPTLVVGIGASAGGLAALQRFFEALPPTPDMAFVVVTHLDPTRASLLDEILQRYTSMPVTQVTGQVEVASNHVYLISPNQRIVITDSHLAASDFEEPRGRRRPIDYFFRSLAAAHRDCVAIILSGSGTDGAVGVKTIKEKGGVLLVQDPEEAEHDGMPRAAIATGLADLVLPVRDLAEHLIAYERNGVKLPTDPSELTVREVEHLQRILTQVHAHTGHDFSQYKRTTVLRRIHRRMQLHSQENLENYLLFLRHQPSEAHALFNDLLIGVTNFFRDSDSWKALATQVIPQLFKGRGAGDSVRVWTIGCATGEEAYTVAMLLMEEAVRLNLPLHKLQLQVFASDLDEGALARAREGIYPAAIEADVSEERLQRFFVKEGDHYRVKRELRDVVIFTSHSVLRDPPFSRVDLISCRNLLIYLQRALQENVYEIFHYALNPDGFLFLGSAESADVVQQLFSTLDKEHRLYQKRPWSGEPPIPRVPLSLRRSPLPPRGPLPARPHAPSENALSPSELHRVTLERESPPSVLVDESNRILHLSETAGRFLQHPGGTVTDDLLHLIRPELHFDLRMALFQAFDKGKNVVTEPVPVRFSGHPHRVSMAVRLRTERGSGWDDSSQIALVLFLEDEINEPDRPLHSGGERDSGTQAEMVKRLQGEVHRLRERLQALVEEHESSTEELRAANEELQSINEEYRSTTEELETSKEELQSVNEELQTVNAELKYKLEEVSRAHSDLENLMASTQIATLFLNRALRIQRFTPELAELFNVQAGDRGRPIAHLTRKLSYPTLEEDAARVLRTLVPIEREVRSESEGWFLVRLLPYRTVDDRIEGVVISFVDITISKQAAEALRESEEQFRALVTVSAQMVWSTDANGLAVEDSPSWRAFTGQSVEERMGHGWVEAIYPDDRELALATWQQALILGSPLETEFRVFHRPSGSYRWTTVRAVPLREDNGTIRGWVAMNLDIDERKAAEHSLRDSQARLRHINETLEQRVAERTNALEQVNQQLVMTRDLFFSLFNANPIPTALTRLDDGSFIDANPAYLHYFGLERDAVIGHTTSQLHPWLPSGARAELAARVQREGALRNLEIATDAPNGDTRVVLFSLQRVRLDGTEAVILAFVDITERKKIEGSLRETNQMLQERTEQVQQLAASLSLAEQEERRRVSQVLHDDLQQLLYSLLMRLQLMLDHAATWNPDLLAANVARITEQLKQAVRVTRSLVTELNPPVLETEGLRRALEWLAGHIEEMYGLKVEISAHEACEPRGTAMRTLLTQMTRELLFNVVKHAGAQHARVRVERVGDELHLHVEDSGDGFDLTALAPPEGEERGYGLHSISRRLELMGGRLELDSTPGDGTRVTLIVPCRTDEAEHPTRR